jgi:hypothetical protein
VRSNNLQWLGTAIAPGLWRGGKEPSNACWCYRSLANDHRKRLERIFDRVRDNGRRRNGAAFTEPFDPSGLCGDKDSA